MAVNDKFEKWTKIGQTIWHSWEREKKKPLYFYQLRILNCSEDEKTQVKKKKVDTDTGERLYPSQKVRCNFLTI